MRSKFNILIFVTVLLIIFILFNCSTTTIIFGLYEIAQRIGIVDMVKDVIITAAREIFLYQGENVEEESRSGFYLGRHKRSPL